MSTDLPPLTPEYVEHAVENMPNSPAALTGSDKLMSLTADELRAELADIEANPDQVPEGFDVIVAWMRRRIVELDPPPEYRRW